MSTTEPQFCSTADGLRHAAVDLGVATACIPEVIAATASDSFTSIEEARTCIQDGDRRVVQHHGNNYAFSHVGMLQKMTLRARLFKEGTLADDPSFRGW
jgi:hypothetical protein